MVLPSGRWQGRLLLRGHRMIRYYRLPTLKRRSHAPAPVYGGLERSAWQGERPRVGRSAQSAGDTNNPDPRGRSSPA